MSGLAAVEAALSVWACVVAGATALAAARSQRFHSSGPAVTSTVSAEDVLLRPVEPSDIPLFFAHAGDPEALRVAAFAPAPPADLEAYRARWSRLGRSSPWPRRRIRRSRWRSGWPRSWRGGAWTCASR